MKTCWFYRGNINVIPDGLNVLPVMESVSGRYVSNDLSLRTGIQGYIITDITGNLVTLLSLSGNLKQINIDKLSSVVLVNLLKNEQISFSHNKH